MENKVQSIAYQIFFCETINVLSRSHLVSIVNFDYNLKIEGYEISSESIENEPQTLSNTVEHLSNLEMIQRPEYNGLLSKPYWQ